MLTEFGLPPIFYFFLLMPFAVSSAGIVRWHRLDTPLRVLVSFVTLDGLGTIVAAYLAYKKLNNLWLTHIFTVLELSCFLYVISRWLSDRTISRWATIVFVVFIVAWTVSKISFESWTSFDSYTSPVEKMILIAFATLALVRFSRDHSTFVFAKASFWVLAGLLIYCTGSLLLFAAGNNLILLSREAAIKVWSTYWIIGCAANLSYVGALVCRKIQ